MNNIIDGVMYELAKSSDLHNLSRLYIDTKISINYLENQLTTIKYFIEKKLIPTSRYEDNDFIIIKSTFIKQNLIREKVKELLTNDLFNSCLKPISVQSLRVMTIRDYKRLQNLYRRSTK